MGGKKNQKEQETKSSRRTRDTAEAKGVTQRGRFSSISSARRTFRPENGRITGGERGKPTRME